MSVPEGLGSWAELDVWHRHWPKIEAAVSADAREILPPLETRFAALQRTSPEKTRVVILGQDPYPTPGHANGLAFSVAPDVALPRSLRNIYRELEDDLGVTRPNGDLGDWADQGVLLLNTALSVPAGDANGHGKLGWHHLTREVMVKLSDHPRAFILWGAKAQGFRQFVAGEGHLFIETAHPSPLSARRGFFGSRPFSKVNDWLIGRGKEPVRW